MRENVCQRNIRELTYEELELVAGGSITITAHPYDPWSDPWWYEQMFEDPYAGDYGSGGGGVLPPDSASQDVTVMIGRPLTQAEQQAVDALNAQITAVSNAINAIPNNTSITLADGTRITGAELKEIWSKTDFAIYDVGHVYANGTTRGEASYNGGDPVVSYNIDTLQQYNALAGGMNYLILHEVGHMTAAGRALNAVINADGQVTQTENDDNERLANDIARAIAANGGLSILVNPGSSYSSTVSTFQVDSGGSSGGGSTTTYYTYDLPHHYAGMFWNRYYNIP
ncbi:hypothetical protein RCO27_11810 [Sphingosinicella sp. LHD-64]|uniref:hypothetical protein n=1 Tax=Sphingosinicella sp. LHD-64 TaxID=3072139 RepID=UPI00280F1C1D|nr:hypothetical protein [Sphingosinicella sp. LHD-64]MDQ8756912.1 hypothetical protein [Sphingosinicella sp. LHD-64]